MHIPVRWIRVVLVFELILVALGALTNSAQPVYGQSAVRATVAVYGLNVRAHPGTTAQIVGSVTAGATVMVEGREDSFDDEGIWVYISHEVTGLQGWALSVYLTFPFGFDISSLPTTSAAGHRPTDPDVATSPSPADATTSIEGALAGTTTGTVNFRSGPGTNYPVIRTLPAGTPVAFTGRNGNSTWLQAVVNSQQGWLFYALVSVEGGLAGLPVVETTPAAAPAGNMGSVPVVDSGSAFPGIISNVGAGSREIFRRGQVLGNRADVFAKVGDSISYSNFFLHPIADGGLQLYGYTYLQPVIDYFSRTPARTHNSFGNDSVATGGGWNSYDVLNPSRNVPGICQPGETPLACEYRVIKPAVALIMLGTNDVAYLSGDEFVTNLRQIIQISRDMGVIPVLSSIPDNLSSPAMTARAQSFNALIRSVAISSGTPFWDYWLALQNLPNKGLGGDGIHPSYNTATGETAIFSPDQLIYGYNMRNLTALMVLDAIWRQVLS
jgi:uncharacterized protein YraI